MKIKVRWRLLIGVLAAVVVLVASVRSAGAGIYRLAGSSMAPGLDVGDLVLVNKVAYGLKAPFTEQRLFQWSDPRRGDVVLVSIPTAEGGTMPAFKRIVGLAGDVVEIRGGRLLINGTEARYQAGDPVGAEGGRHQIETLAGLSYPVLLAEGACDDFAPAVVPQGHYFLLGDSRGNSRDSRHFGPLSRRSIHGRISAVLSRAGAQP